MCSIFNKYTLLTVCYKIFAPKNNDAFRQHLGNHPKALTKKVKLKHCSKTEKSKTQPQSELIPQSKATQKRKKSLICEKCGFESQSTPARIAHEKSHAEKKYHCRFCPRKFISDKVLQKHVSSRICMVEKRQCGICHKVLSDPTRLKNHRRQHRQEKV